jgi:hypothetical protein
VVGTGGGVDCVSVARRGGAVVARAVERRHVFQTRPGVARLGWPPSRGYARCLLPIWEAATTAAGEVAAALRR